MQKLTQAGDNLVSNISSRYNLSRDAVIHMLVAVNNGGGSMAQFNCPELGGGGQWMRGGMIMVGDMFNNGLKNTVDNLCNELSSALANMTVFPVIPAGTPGSNQWWPVEYGPSFSSGAQNNIRYAVLQGKLAVELNGQVTVYDTLNHNIGGVSQQQGGDSSLTFSSQFGTISVNQLPIISGANQNPQPPHQAPQQPPQQNFAEPQMQAPSQQPMNNPVQNNAPPMQNSNSGSISKNASVDEIINLIEKLSKLRDAGAISDQDYSAKKLDLLDRI